MLNVANKPIMNVVMMSVVMLNVVAPTELPQILIIVTYFLAMVYLVIINSSGLKAEAT
jgi:hypothetical protein